MRGKAAALQMACTACRKSVIDVAQASGKGRSGWSVNDGAEQQRQRGGTKDPELRTMLRAT